MYNIYQLTSLCQMVVVCGHASLTLAMQVHFLAASFHYTFGFMENWINR